MDQGHYSFRASSFPLPSCRQWILEALSIQKSGEEDEHFCQNQGLCSDTSGTDPRGPVQPAAGRIGVKAPGLWVQLSTGKGCCGGFIWVQEPEPGITSSNLVKCWDSMVTWSESPEGLRRGLCSLFGTNLMYRRSKLYLLSLVLTVFLISS